MRENTVSLNNKTLLVTGAAGFIGSNLVLELIRMGQPMTIVGLDNLNDYYDVSLKDYRLRQIEDAAARNPGKLDFCPGQSGGQICH